MHDKIITLIFKSRLTVEILASEGASIRIVQKRDFKGTTGEDHFIISDEVYEVANTGDKVILEFEQENHSHFKEINPRFDYIY